MKSLVAGLLAMLVVSVITDCAQAQCDCGNNGGGRNGYYWYYWYNYQYTTPVVKHYTVPTNGCGQLAAPVTQQYVAPLVRSYYSVPSAQSYYTAPVYVPSVGPRSACPTPEEELAAKNLAAPTASDKKKLAEL